MTVSVERMPPAASARLRTQAAATAGLTGRGNQYVDRGDFMSASFFRDIGMTIDRPACAAAVFHFPVGPLAKKKPGPKAKHKDRYPCGKARPVNDGPTPELLAKRQRLVGDQERKQRYASYPLGVLYACHKVSSGAHYAGKRYARLFSAAVRPLTIPSILGNLVASGGLVMAMGLVDEIAGTEIDPTTGKIAPYGTAARAAYLAARRVLERRGTIVAQSVDSLVLYEIAPRTTKRLEAIRDGLDALHRHFEEVDARSRAAMAG
jgi:hypothetical protein